MFVGGAGEGAHPHRERNPGLDVRTPRRAAELAGDGDAANVVIRSGAGGFRTNETAPERLADAVRTCAAGRRSLTPKVSALLATAVASELPEEPHVRSRTASRRCSRSSPRAARWARWRWRCTGV